MKPAGLAQLAAIGGESLETGWHLRFSKSLDYIWANPDEVSNNEKNPDTFTPSLTGYAWDAVTLQPSNGPESTLGTDETSILNFIDLAQSNPDNADTRFYVYAAWPTRGNYEGKWTASIPDEDSTSTIRAREYFEHLIDRLDIATSANVLMVPIGEVFFEIDQRIQAGKIPGMTSIEQFYRDDVHLAYDVGRYTAAATVYATIFGKDPTGLTKPDDFYGSADAFTPQLYNALHTAIWDVVANHPFTGISDPSILVGDVDFDADVDFDDIDAAVLGIGDPDAYVAAFGVEPARRGDTDGDGDFDFDDIPGFVALLESGAGGNLSQSVPEPATVTLVAFALLSIVWGSRRPGRVIGP